MVYDCAEECGGDAEEDNCGVCDDDPENNCSDAPLEFSFNSSSQIGYYFIQYVSIDNILVDPNDWVGAFNGDVCVGAQRWNTDNCQNGICEITVYGDEDTDLTSGYMTNGSIPSFKIYDYSENIIYNVNSYSQDLPPWIYLVSHVIESIGVLEDCSGILGGNTALDECGI